jgi:hypothetical protein
MTVVYWICGILFVLLASSSALFFMLHIASGEHVPRERAVALFHWTKVVALGTFDIWIFKRVIDAIIVLVR